MKRLVVRNLGRVVSGDLARPFVDADTIVVSGDRIEALGPESAVGVRQDDVVIDAQGGVLLPGLIDSHAHPVCGDFQPRLRVLDHISSTLECGTTSIVSAGETHYPGIPRDAAGVKALSLLACKSFQNAPPRNVRVYAGSILLERGLTETDFKELAAAGVRFVGEIGLSTLQDPSEIRPLVGWARQHGMRVMCHTGGPSLPGSAHMTAETILAIGPDILSHVNGGPAALSDDQIKELIAETSAAAEVTFVGNLRTLRLVAGTLGEREELGRLIIGSDMPSGSGFVPAALLYTIAYLSSQTAVTPAQAVAMATGNSARVLGIPGGRIVVGAEADFMIVDSLVGSAGRDALEALAAGDLVGVALVVLRGEVAVWPSRYTPRARRACVLERGAIEGRRV